MVRHYKPKSERGDAWTQEELLRAKQAVQRKEMSLSKASKVFAIPKTTLGRHVRGKTDIKFPGVKRFGRETALRAVFELELEQYVLKLQQMFHGITQTDLRTLAFDLAEKNELPHPFNKRKCMAG